VAEVPAVAPVEPLAPPVARVPAVAPPVAKLPAVAPPAPAIAPAPAPLSPSGLSAEQAMMAVVKSRAELAAKKRRMWGAS
jgi:hypothetical protein